MTDEDRDEARASAYAGPTWTDALIAFAKGLFEPVKDAAENAVVAVAFLESNYDRLEPTLVELIAELNRSGRSCGWLDQAGLDRIAWSATDAMLRGTAASFATWYKSAPPPAPDEGVVSAVAEYSVRSTEIDVSDNIMRICHVQETDLEGTVIFWVRTFGDRGEAIRFTTEAATYALLRLALDVAPSDHRWWCANPSEGIPICDCDQPGPDPKAKRTFKPWTRLLNLRAVMSATGPAL